MRGNETVVHPPSLSSRGHDARPAEVRQVAGNLRLAGPEDLHEVANANFLVGNEVEQAKPRAIGQGAKEQVDGKRFFLSVHPGNYIWLDRYVQGEVW